MVIKWHACTIAPRCTRQEMWQLVVIKWSSVIIKWSSVIAYCRGQPWRCDLDAQRHCDGGGDAHGGLDGQRPAAVQHNAKSQHKPDHKHEGLYPFVRFRALSARHTPTSPEASLAMDGRFDARGPLRPRLVGYNDQCKTLIQGACSLARCRSARRGVGCTVVTEYGKATTQINTPHVPSKYLLNSTMR